MKNYRNRWRFSGLIQTTRVCVVRRLQPCCVVGLDDAQRSLPTPVILQLHKERLLAASQLSAQLLRGKRPCWLSCEWKSYMFAKGSKGLVISALHASK